MRGVVKRYLRGPVLICLGGFVTMASMWTASNLVTEYVSRGLYTDRLQLVGELTMWMVGLQFAVLCLVVVVYECVLYKCEKNDSDTETSE